MYKNIIFDLGGVMVDWKPKDYLMKRFYHAKTEEAVYNLTFGSQTWSDLDAGLLTRSDGNKKMTEEAEKAGYLFEVQEVLDDWQTILRPNRRLIDYVKRLRQHGYSIYYLSNIPEDTLNYVMGEGLKGLFDGGLASYEVKVNKPDERIFRAFFQKYLLMKRECVFVDDNPDNVEAAFSFGMAAIRMQGSVGTLIRDLASCNVT